MKNPSFPDYSRNICALADEIMWVFGLGEHQSSLNLDLSGRKKIAMVVLDGFGWNVFSRLGLQKDHDVRKSTSVFPSTTATALVSMLTGLPPGSHGIIGYRTFSKQAGGLIKPLEFTYAFTHRSETLGQIGEMRDMFKADTLIHKLAKRKVRSTVFNPSFIQGSSYSDFLFSHAKYRTGYDNIWDALYLYKKELETGKSRFVFLYIPYIDTLEHVYGNSHEITTSAASYILNKLLDINVRNKKNVASIITADHGHTDIEEDINLGSDAALMKKLEIPPYGDGRAPLFRSRADIRQELSKYDMEVLEKGYNQRLFGRIDGSVADILPDFIGLPGNNKSYYYRYNLRPKMKEKGRQASNHGGLSQDEMEIPLIIV